MYLTYDEYQELGGTLEETAFAQLEFEARTVIDWWTFHRLRNETSYPTAVKRCIFKLISLIGDKQTATVVNTQTAIESGQVGIASESNDGVSISYNTLTAKDTVTTVEKEIETTVQTYLSGVRNSLGHKLLYRGIYPDE